MNRGTITRSLTNARRVTISPTHQVQGNEEAEDDEETVAFEQRGQDEEEQGDPMDVIETTEDRAAGGIVSPTQHQEQGTEAPDDEEETVAYEQYGQVEEQRQGIPVDIIEIKEEEQEPNAVVAEAVETPESATQAVDRILASVARLNDQISWISNNPDEQSEAQAKSMKAKLARAKERLLNELDQHDSEVQVFL